MHTLTLCFGMFSRISTPTLCRRWQAVCLGQRRSRPAGLARQGLNTYGDACDRSLASGEDSCRIYTLCLCDWCVVVTACVSSYAYLFVPGSSKPALEPVVIPCAKKTCASASVICRRHESARAMSPERHTHGRPLNAYTQAAFIVSPPAQSRFIINLYCLGRVITPIYQSRVCACAERTGAAARVSQ